MSFFFFRLFSSAIFDAITNFLKKNLGGKNYHFTRKIWENFVFSSVNSINFANFSEIIINFFVTKNWKRRGERAKGHFSIDEISTKKKKTKFKIQKWSDFGGF